MRYQCPGVSRMAQILIQPSAYQAMIVFDYNCAGEVFAKGMDRGPPDGKFLLPTMRARGRQADYYPFESCQCQ
jgi:hypothetical protein